jgi:1,4-alpha-glucan branching enzyme
MTAPSKNSKTQTFRFTAPDASSVLLAGDFTQWQQRPIPMHQDQDGIWTASVKLARGKHPYRFVVDSEWRDDPKCTVRVANPFGGEDMVREAA